MLNSSSDFLTNVAAPGSFRGSNDADIFSIPLIFPHGRWRSVAFFSRGTSPVINVALAHTTRLTPGGSHGSVLYRTQLRFDPHASAARRQLSSKSRGRAVLPTKVRRKDSDNDALWRCALETRADFFRFWKGNRWTVRRHVCKYRIWR